MVGLAEDWEREVARLDGRVDSLAGQVHAHSAADEKAWAANEARHKELYETASRPAWSTTYLLGGMMSALVGLVVYVATRR